MQAPLSPAVPIPLSLHDLSYAGLADELTHAGVSSHHTKALWRALYRDDTLAPATPATPATAERLLPPLQRWLATHLGPSKKFFLERLEVADEIPSSDGLTRKFLLRLSDGLTIETVLMRYDGRHTACVSTQVGCAMGCVFCATGQMGFIRHLRPGEIIAQVLHVRRVLKSIDPTLRLRNLVLMGMGEPLHNYDAVMQALETIADVRGIGIGPSKISISTVGVVPGIQRLAAENRPYRLAVSLHGSTQAERAALIPVARKWPLEELMEACRNYGSTTGRRILFEWTLIAGHNDSPEVAARLVDLLHGMDAHVNLIPLNPTQGYAGSASGSGQAFKRIIQAGGFPCTLRQHRGIDVAAGCGQLKAANRVGIAPQAASSC